MNNVHITSSRSGHGEITVDGVPLKRVRSIALRIAVDEVTTVTVEQAAEKVVIETEAGVEIIYVDEAGNRLEVRP